MMSQMLRLPSQYPKATWNGLFLFIFRHLMGLWTANTVGNITNAYKAMIPSINMLLPYKLTSFPLRVIWGLGGRCTLGSYSSSYWFMRVLMNSSYFFYAWTFSFFSFEECLPRKDVEIFLSYFSREWFVVFI